jgi:hypothetical protein
MLFGTCNCHPRWPISRRGLLCAGRFYDVARNELGDKVMHSAVGTRFVFEA